MRAKPFDERNGGLSKFLGVTHRGARWEAVATVAPGAEKHLGSFGSEIAAARAVSRAAAPQLLAAAAEAAGAEAAAAAAAEQQKWLAQQKRIGNRMSLTVGLKLRKLFVGHGVFQGVVKQKRRDAVGHYSLFRVEYEDGDAEDMTEVQLRACLRPA